MRRISSSVTIGLLAKPQTPLWITRTPKPAAPLGSSPSPPNRRRSRRAAAAPPPPAATAAAAAESAEAPRTSRLPPLALTPLVGAAA